MESAATVIFFGSSAMVEVCAVQPPIASYFWFLRLLWSDTLPISTFKYNPFATATRSNHDEICCAMRH